MSLGTGFRRPQPKGGKISGTGNILCRLRADNPVLISQLSKCSARFLFKDSMLPGVIEDRSFVDRDGNFRKRVEFSVSDRQRKMSLSLKEGSCPPKNVSGSPFSVDSLVAAQGMDADFGRAYHKKRRQPAANRKAVKSEFLECHTETESNHSL